jgi:hypothetical protein
MAPQVSSDGLGAVVDLVVCDTESPGAGEEPGW